jgi:DNA/RNA endonuclease YhcR with UshA esterase domain
LRKISLKYAGKCVRCGRWIREGETAYWEKGSGVWHLDCGEYHRENAYSRSAPGKSRVTRPVVIAILIIVVAVAAGVAILPYMAPKPETVQSGKWLPASTKVILWSEASAYMNQYVTVEGTVVYTYNSLGTIFLDFHFPYQGYFYAVIFSSSSQNFPFSPTDFFLNKEVRITGTIQPYNGSPEIIVSSPSQIEVAYSGFNYP